MRRRYSSSVFLIALVLMMTASGPAAVGPVMRGYSKKNAGAEQRIEEKFQRIPSPQRERQFHRVLTAQPHPAGSARNNELARYIARKWKEQGWEDVKIHRYDVLNSTPRSVTAELVSPIHYRASLREKAYPEDPDTKNPKVHSGYLGFSASGDVTAPLVYAHSGNPEDYDVLRRNGIDVRGKIVIVRYSNPYSYRGFKALTAERMGAAAIIIYSDPAEDGYKQGKVFPDGPWGPESHIQRGAIAYDFIRPGDPLTPGWPSLPGAKRIPVSQAPSVPKIPGLPMSWGEAKHFLERLDGPEAPPDWQGGLPIKYHLGGGNVRVHVKVDMDTSITPYYVVEARITGYQVPDEWIVMGNHRDAWEFGGVDPSSGTAAMMEMTRAIGELKRQGIRPKRTLVVCSWDGEEYTLTGSTEWGEQYQDELKKKAVAYINVDEATSGPNFRPDAVPSLAGLLTEISKELPAPSGKTLYDEWKASLEKERRTEKHATPVIDSNMVDTRIGSGSDHTVFLNYLGVPTIGLEFDGPYGVYHSVYDDFYWINHFGDPGYRYHTLMSVFWGTLAMRLANADILPFDFAFYGANVKQFIETVAKDKGVKEHLDLESLLKGASDFESAGADLDRAVAEKLSTGDINPGQARELNQRIIQAERNFLNPDGIPGRPFFRHTLYACRYTYAHLELPGLTEAVEAGKWDVAAQQAAIIQKALEKNVELLKVASAKLN